MKKLSDYEDKTKQAIEDTVEHQGKQIVDTYYDESYTKVDDDYGLCTDCKEFKITKMEFGDVFAECQTWDTRRRSQRRVTECSRYDKRGQMNLAEMQQIAYIIEVGGRRVGMI